MFAQTELQTEPQTEIQFDPTAVSFRLATQELLKRGIPVVPIPPKEKGCQLRNWPDLATTDRTVIAEWRKNGLDQNAGAVATADGFCIVDWDDINLIKQLPHELPKTLVVQSSKGLHYYFKQTDATRALGNTHMEDPADPKHRLFDFQQHRKYVVAPHIHPSGKIYTIIDHSEIVECPDWLTAWLKEKGVGSQTQTQTQAKTQTEPKKLTGLVISPGTSKAELERWFDLHGESLFAPTFDDTARRWEWIREARCPWEDEHTTKNGEKDFAIYLNEDGVLGVKCVHSHEKHWSDYRDYLSKQTGHDFSMATGEKVFLTDIENQADEWVDFPHDALLGGWLGEVTDIVTAGTTLSKEIADMYQRVILGILIDGHVGWHNTAPMHMKTWAINIAPAGTGKGELWKRLGSDFMWSDSTEGGIPGVYGKLLKTYNCEIIYGLGSSEGLIDSLKDSNAYRTITRFDEISGLFEKNARVGSSMLSSLRSLFDQAKLENRTVSRGVQTLYARLGLSADIQPEVFDKLVSANSLREDGFLRRVVFAHADQTAHGNLPSLTAEQIEKLAGLLTKISARVDELKAYGYDHPAEIQFKPMNYQKALCPVIAGEAKALYDKFLKELNMAFKDDRIQGLAEYLRRDILLRTLFSDDYKTVSVEAVKQAIAWTRYQWEVRNHTWRESFDEKAAAMEAAITDTFKRYAAKCGKKYDLKQGMTRREVYVFGNLQRKGGLDHFNRTFMNMQGVHLIREVKKVKIKNHGDLPVYVRD